MISDKAQKYKICLITPGHISTNPRLIKEAAALIEAGYRVHLVFTQYLNHCSIVDRQILEANPQWTFSCLNWETTTLKSRILRYTSGICNKLSRFLFRRFKTAGRIAINRHFNWQLNAAVRVKADLYAGHNLAALPVAVEAARKNAVVCGFDAEDFHRFEESDDINDLTVILKSHIEQKYIPALAYMTAASPLIAKEYANFYNKPVPCILNLFPSSFIPEPKASDEAGPIRLFWFSQWIGRGRGIEEIIRAIGLLKNYKLELHLLGEIFENDRIYFEQLSKENLSKDHLLRFYTPIHPDEIIPFASRFDIGMASEISRPYNRDICLTNKIFTYIQSGLAVLASDTSAQTAFMNEFQSPGKLYKKGDHEDLAKALGEFITDRNTLYLAKSRAYELSKLYLNWETERNKYISIIHGLFSAKDNAF